MLKDFSLVLKLNNDSKTTTSVQNHIIQTEDPGRHVTASAETFQAMKKPENISEIVQELISSHPVPCGLTCY